MTITAAFDDVVDFLYPERDSYRWNVKRGRKCYPSSSENIERYFIGDSSPTHLTKSL